MYSRRPRFLLFARRGFHNPAVNPVRGMRLVPFFVEQPVSPPPPLTTHHVRFSDNPADEPSPDSTKTDECENPELRSLPLTTQSTVARQLTTVTPMIC